MDWMLARFCGNVKIVLRQLAGERLGGNDCRIVVLEAVHVFERQVEDDPEGVLGAGSLLIGESAQIG